MNCSFALSCESLLMNDAYDSELKIKEINDIVAFFIIIIICVTL